MSFWNILQFHPWLGCFLNTTKSSSHNSPGVIFLQPCNCFDNTSQSLRHFWGSLWDDDATRGIFSRAKKVAGFMNRDEHPSFISRSARFYVLSIIMVLKLGIWLKNAVASMIIQFYLLFLQRASEAVTHCQRACPDWAAPGYSRGPHASFNPTGNLQ